MRKLHWKVPSPDEKNDENCTKDNNIKNVS